MMRLIEQITYHGILEHSRVHDADNLQTMLFEGGNGSFDKCDRLITQWLRHGGFLGGEYGIQMTGGPL